MSRHSQLDLFLGAMYRADVMHEGSWEGARDALVKLLLSSQEVRTEAEQRLETARQVIAKRKLNAHVETRVVRYLEEVLPLVKKKEKTHG